jgi:hypothetical protein
MSTQKRNLLIGIILLIIACVFFFVLKDAGTKKNNEKKAEESEKYLYQMEDAQVNKYIISDDSEKITLKKESDTNWHIQGQEKVELMQLSIDQAVEYLKTLEYTQVIDNGSERLSDFGLDRGITAEAVADDGRTMKVTVGNTTVDQKGYYILKDGDPNVYVIDAECGKALSYTPSLFRNKYPEYVDYSNINYIDIKRKNGKSFRITPNPTGEITDGYGEYLLTGAYSWSIPILTDKLSKNIGGPLYEIVANDFIDDPKDDSAYGFDDPQLICQIVDKAGRSCTITIGNSAGANTVYAKFSGKNYVCTVLKEKSDKIMNVNLFDIIGKYFINDDANAFSEIELAGSGVSSKFEIDGKNNKVSLNGNNIDIDTFKDMYRNIAGLTIDGEADESKAGEPVLRMVLTKSDGESTIYQFLEYDSNYYAVSRNGYIEFLTGKRNIDNLIKAVK